MTRCIVCDAAKVEMFLDLGSTTLANKFLAAEDLAEPEPAFPLRVGFCHACGHVQLTECVPPGAMFSDYLYISGISDTLRAHLHDLSDVVVERYRPGSQDLVMDIGCNDGTLLTGFRRHGVRVLGVDPAENLAALNKDAGIDRFVGFFGSTSAQTIVARWGKAKVITSTNCFPHIPQLNDFMEGINTALAPGGVFVIEMHYLADLLEQVAFDTIYHEHVSYWALKPMMTLFERHGLMVTNAECLPLHHGQLRVCVQRKGEGKVLPAVERILAAEDARGMGRFETYQRFAQQTMKIKTSLTTTLRNLKTQGKRIVGYGAPAKGNTLLSFLGLGPDLVEYIADRSPLKQGRYTPGTHIPVVSPDRLLAEQPDYVLLLAWNFADEVMAQQAEYARRGGRFILPVPEVRTVPPGAAQVADRPRLYQENLVTGPAARLTISGGGEEISCPLYSEEGFAHVAALWLKLSAQYRRMYDARWLGVPIIQLADDIVVVQELIWQLRPDVIIETGVAHGGSVILSASICELIGHGQVVGIDVEIRPHNRAAIEAHPLKKRIHLVEGSSIAPDVFAQAKAACAKASRVLVLLDSNHTTAHVAKELELYHQLVTPGSYLVAMDGAQRDVWDIPRGKKEWRDDHPLIAVAEFLKTHPEFVVEPYWTRLAVTASPGGFLRRLAPAEVRAA